jgi:hypothetical protein
MGFKLWCLQLALVCKLYGSKQRYSLMLLWESPSSRISYPDLPVTDITCLDWTRRSSAAASCYSHNRAISTCRVEVQPKWSQPLYSDLPQTAAYHVA